MLVYRIQPSGLGLHLDGSTRSAGGTDLDGYLDAFELAWQVIADPDNVNYGDEILEIDTPAAYDNDDIEGVCFDPKTARITRRWTWGEFCQYFDATDPRDAYDRLHEGRAPDLDEIPADPA